MSANVVERWWLRSARVHALVLGMLATPVLFAYALEWPFLDGVVGGWSIFFQLVGWVIFEPLSYAYGIIMLMLLGWRVAVGLFNPPDSPASPTRRLSVVILSLALAAATAMLYTAPWLPEAPQRRVLTWSQTLGCLAAMHGCGGGKSDPHARQRRVWQAAGVGCGAFALAFLGGGLWRKPGANSAAAP